jgi:hypothetical protein
LAIDDHPSVVAAGKSDGRFLACSPDTGLSDVGVQQVLRRKLSGLVRGQGRLQKADFKPERVPSR